jgi:hypothetical protein
VSSPSYVALLLLSIVAPLGAFDVLYFHMWKLRLASRRASRAETVTHVARSLLIGALAWILARFEPHGAWYVVVASLMALDFVNNLLDVWLEGPSRADLGGVPRLEYLIHVIGATASGAVTASFVVLGRGLVALPTELVEGAIPSWLAWNAQGIAVGCLVIAVVEGSLLARAIAQDMRTLAPETS